MTLPITIVATKQIWLNLAGLGVLMALLGLVYWLHTGVRAVPGLVGAFSRMDFFPFLGVHYVTNVARASRRGE